MGLLVTLSLLIVNTLCFHFERDSYFYFLKFILGYFWKYIYEVIQSDFECPFLSSFILNTLVCQVQSMLPGNLFRRINSGLLLYPLGPRWVGTRCRCPQEDCYSLCPFSNLAHWRLPEGPAQPRMLQGKMGAETGKNQSGRRNFEFNPLPTMVKTIPLYFLPKVFFDWKQLDVLKGKHVKKEFWYFHLDHSASSS